jgi:hypothetical protein
MPQSANKKHHKDIQDPSLFRDPVSSQGIIEIIPEPGGKGNMPALPELRNILYQVGRFKVIHNPDSQKQGASNSNGGISEEIAVDLKRV